MNDELRYKIYKSTKIDANFIILWIAFYAILYEVAKRIGFSLVAGFSITIFWISVVASVVYLFMPFKVIHEMEDKKYERVIKTLEKKRK